MCVVCIAPAVLDALFHFGGLPYTSCNIVTYNNLAFMRVCGALPHNIA